ncbi:hypothetical protein ABKV19_001775 [Rosa sericea]
MSTVPGSSSDLSQEGVVDLEDKKNDDHSTRKRPYNTESKPVRDLCGNKGDSPRKRPLVMSDSESAEPVCEFANNSTSGQKGNPIVRALPQNTPISDFLKAEAEAEAEAEAGDVLPKVYPPGYVPPKGYAMVCQLCGVVNCRTPGLSRPVKMSCCFCKENGTHYSLDCKKFRGPPMPERYSCFYWKLAI